MLLEATIKKDIRKLQVMGDSKLVIDCSHQKVTATYVRLTPLLRNIKLSYQCFECLSFNHILRKINSKIDELSKEALSLPKGAFGLYEFIDGEEIEAMEFCF
jgi:hypothetical protein